MTAKSITTHTIILVVEKMERAIAKQAQLKAQGYNVVLSLSFYDAIKNIEQELPHIIISEAILTDATVGELYDHLQKDPTLKRIPIIVSILKKSPNEINAIGKRKFAGFFLGTPEPKALFTKIQQVASSYSGFSPFFIKTEGSFNSENPAILFDAEIYGKQNNFLICKSDIRLELDTIFKCYYHDHKINDLILKNPVSFKSESKYINLFPLNRISGQSRQWVEQLADIPRYTVDSHRKKIIFFHPDKIIYEEFLPILEGYHFQLQFASTRIQAITMYQHDDENICAIYSHVSENEQTLAEWAQFLLKFQDIHRPHLFIKRPTIKTNPMPDYIHYLNNPFSLGEFIETLETTREKEIEIRKSIQTHSPTIVQLKSPAKIIGLDETGGMLELSFPLEPCSRFSIEHSFLENLWSGNLNAKCTALLQKENSWQIAFEADYATNTNKEKYWQKLSEALKTAKQKPNE